MLNMKTKERKHDQELKKEYFFNKKFGFYH